MRDWFARLVAWLRGIGGNVVSAATGKDSTVAWPPEQMAARLRRYQEGERLYTNADDGHRKVFEAKGFKWSSIGESDWPYIGVTLAGSGTNLIVERAVGEGISVQAPAEAPGTQAFLHNLCEQNDLNGLLVELATTLSWAGDAALKVRYDQAEQRIAVNLVWPDSIAEVVPDERNASVTRMVRLAEVLRRGEDTFLWVETHERREEGSWVTNAAWRLRGDAGSYCYDPARDRVQLARVAGLEGLADEVATGIDELLVVPFVNRPSRVLFPHGRSDYSGNENLLGQINSAETMVARILRQHSDPAMWGPRDALDGTGLVRLSEGKYFGVPEGASGAPMGYVVWPSDLAAMENALQRWLRLWAAVFGIDMAVLVPPEGGGPQSGRAMRFAQHRTQTTAKRKQARLDGPLRQVLAVATQLAAAVGTANLAIDLAGAPLVGLRRADMAITWADGLPQDRIEDVDEQTRMIESGVQSRVRAIRALHGLGDEAAQALAGEIAQEANQGAPVGLVPSAGFPIGQAPWNQRPAPGGGGTPGV